MINDLIKYFENKKILILGFGREGISTYKLIRKYLNNLQLFIADKNEKIEENCEFLKDDKNVTIIKGEKYLDGLENYDLIMKAPGVSLAYRDTSKYITKIKSQLELLLEFFNVQTIGITGTKGKSTTSSLIYKVLKDQDIPTLFLGNIGIPVFDYIDSIKENMKIVLEMSSHQLEYMKLSPNISIILNIFEEHLDHYESYEKYIEAKCQIYKNQKVSDYFIYNVDNEILANHIEKNNAKTFKVSMKNKVGSNVYLKDDKIVFNGKELYDINTPRNLLGDYNLNNIMFVLTVSEILGLDLNKTIKSISEFKTLPHRLEFVGEFDGVFYYDNSIATIPEGTIEAIKALNNVNSLIIGGMDRGVDYKLFIEYLNSCNVENIICMLKTGHDIAKELKAGKAIVVQDLEEAVKKAKEVTKKGMSCLLSPAAASYGFFKNFEEKGDMFQKLVKEIRNKNGTKK